MSRPIDATLVSTLNSAYDGAADSIVSLITTNAPILIGVVVAMVGIAFAIKLLRKLGRG